MNRFIAVALILLSSNCYGLGGVRSLRCLFEADLSATPMPTGGTGAVTWTFARDSLSTAYIGQDNFYHFAPKGEAVFDRAPGTLAIRGLRIEQQLQNMVYPSGFGQGKNGYFNSSRWVFTRLTPGPAASIGPDNISATGYALIEDATASSSHYVAGQSCAVQGNSTSCAIVVLKGGSVRTWAQVCMIGTNANLIVKANVNLATGALGTCATGGNASSGSYYVESVGGWWVLKMNWYETSGSVRPMIAIGESDDDVLFSGDDSSSIFVAGVCVYSDKNYNPEYMYMSNAGTEIAYHEVLRYVVTGNVPTGSGSISLIASRRAAQTAPARYAYLLTTTAGEDSGNGVQLRDDGAGALHYKFFQSSAQCDITGGTNNLNMIPKMVVVTWHPNLFQYFEGGVLKGTDNGGVTTSAAGQFGVGNVNSGTQRPWCGWIRHLRVFDSPLTLREVEELK